MARCEMCGNDYDRSFTITRGDRTATYDSLECAISAWAPACGNCGCRILGHGVEAGDAVYCCSHCARAAEGATHSDHMRSPR